MDPYKAQPYNHVLARRGQRNMNGMMGLRGHTTTCADLAERDSKEGGGSSSQAAWCAAVCGPHLS